MVQILSGLYKGKKLHLFSKSLPIRPMTQRVKKSVFDTLSPYLNEKTRVLDLFSGSGQLSFEALSRGVLLSEAVEKHRLCFKLIQKNCQKLQINSSKFRLHLQDVFKFLKKYPPSYHPFNIIFADPPFSHHLGDEIIKSLKLSFACDKKTLVVLELSIKEEITVDSVFSLISKKTFGDKAVYFFYLK